MSSFKKSFLVSEILVFFPICGVDISENKVLPCSPPSPRPLAAAKCVTSGRDDVHVYRPTFVQCERKLTPSLSLFPTTLLRFRGLTLESFLEVLKIVGTASRRSLRTFFKPKLAYMEGSKQDSSKWVGLLDK